MCTHAYIFYVADYSVYIHSKNITPRPLLKSYTQVCTVKSNSSCSLVRPTLLYLENTAVAEMVIFKEAGVNISGFNKKREKR